MAKQAKPKVEIKISPTKLSNKRDSLYQTRTFEEIRKATNALQNNGGGTIILRYNESPPRGHVRMCMRKLEQKIQSFLGVIALTFDIDIIDIPASPHGHGEIRIIVKTLTTIEAITTLHYNMYLPSAQQVNEISPPESGEKVRAILTRTKSLVEPTEPGSHHKSFVKGETVSFCESKTIQFKKLKDEKSKKTSFAIRVVSSGNKFRCYVSAFANYAGGHIYYGINDDEIVVGEHISEEEQKKVTETIRKEIEKMEWPEKCTARDDKRWAVHFEPVKDDNKEIISSLYVVVVFVAQCPGGVFTEAPECYDIVENEVKKMDFATWKRRIDPSLANQETSAVIAPRDLVYEELTTILNKKCNEDSKELEDRIVTVKEKYKSHEQRHEVILICLSKSVSYNLRRGNDDEAEKILGEYHKLLSKACNTLHFKVTEQYLLSIMERCRGDYEKSYKIASDCMDDLKRLPPCIISAAFYVQIGTVEHILAIKAKNCEERGRLLSNAEDNYNTADSHLNSIHGHSATKAEFEQKININKCLLHLGSSPAGDMLPNSDGIIDIEEGSSYLIKMQKVKYKGYPLSNFRTIQKLFAEASLFYRTCMRSNKSALHPTELLQHVVMYTEQAQTLAKKCEFKEMTRYAENFNNFFQSELQSKSNTKACQ